MLVECPRCEARVSAEDLGHVEPPVEDPDLHYRITLLKCPSCLHPVVARQTLDIAEGPDGEADYHFGSARRVWPEPETALAYAIPAQVRLSLEEAVRVFRARSYMACAVMAGRAVEELCADKQAKGERFVDQLKDLHDRKVIDTRIYEWADALRVHRNLGAHATGRQISRDDARDLVEFAEAICEYVYVLTRRFDRFMERQPAKSTAATQLKKSGGSKGMKKS